MRGKGEEERDRGGAVWWSSWQRHPSTKPFPHNPDSPSPIILSPYPIDEHNLLPYKIKGNPKNLLEQIVIRIDFQKITPRKQEIFTLQKVNFPTYQSKLSIFSH